MFNHHFFDGEVQATTLVFDPLDFSVQHGQALPLVRLPGQSCRPSSQSAMGRRWWWWLTLRSVAWWSLWQIVSLWSHRHGGSCRALVSVTVEFESLSVYVGHIIFPTVYLVLISLILQEENLSAVRQLKNSKTIHKRRQWSMKTAQLDDNLLWTHQVSSDPFQKTHSHLIHCWCPLFETTIRVLCVQTAVTLTCPWCGSSRISLNLASWSVSPHSPCWTTRYAGSTTLLAVD